jgi:DNA polymerase-3 subunit delta'
VVAVARRWLVEIATAPVDATRRIVVIEQADACNESIQNALLKALEEPAARHVFVLVADDADRLLPTIRSRCHPLRIGAVPHATLVEWLTKAGPLPRDQAESVARLAHGRVGLAWRFTRRTELVEWRRTAQVKLLSLLRRGRAERLGSVRDLLDDAGRVEERPQIAESEADVVDAEPAVTGATAATGVAARTPAARQRAGALALADVWLGLARDLAVTAAGRGDAATGRDLLPDLESAARGIGPLAAARFVRRLEEIRAGLNVNVSPRLALEVAMLEWPTLDAAA